MKKNDKLHIPISTDKKNILKKRAEALEMPLSQYCLLVLMNAKPKIDYNNN